MPDHRTWNEIRELNRRVIDLGEPFALTDEIRALLIGTASEVAIAPQEVSQALQGDASAAALLKEIAKRIRVGSWRLSRALAEVDKRQEEGDLDAARAPLLELLDVEVVPFYRELAQVQLDALDEP
ncbi:MULTISPECIES: DUSAM domain-containing protein [unclassified Myxococcus]|uniref:DUSAM domain-containing protein n=1 Tax=unclassified Myxococcus TaxID=2648731 RepID=UPI00157ADC31|nr:MULTISPECIES: DUSAM domain-containing protein [unclassified Myxococcus]NTX07096.1 DUSAM domain-containing protein [Myxococcus sp. CA040A]NTX17430.1 DUSAM domain-containing protein [Myxococcus sp. CA056]NTX39009.1 DUSAM domain-containing protein [Myxococcus sp. CA033]